MGRPAPSYKKLTTVILEAEKIQGEDRHNMFYCYNCRTPVIQYQGDILHVVPGQHPYEPSTVIKCKGNRKNEAGVWEECGYYFSFLSTVYSKTKVY